jgi:hypothetical protein
MANPEKVEATDIEAGTDRQAETAEPAAKNKAVAGGKRRAAATEPARKPKVPAVKAKPPTPAPAPRRREAPKGAGAPGPERRGFAAGRTLAGKSPAADYPLTRPALDALDVFLALDNKAKEGFLARAGILALSYRKWEGEGRGDYSVVFPTITAAASGIVENVARATACIQRFFDEGKNGSLLLTPKVSKCLAQQTSMWDTASPRHLVDILEAVEFEAAYLSASAWQRGSYEFRNYKPLEDSDDLEELLKHYTAYKRKRYGKNYPARFEYRRIRNDQRPGSVAGPAGPPGRDNGRTNRQPEPRAAGRPDNGKYLPVQTRARTAAQAPVPAASKPAREPGKVRPAPQNAATQPAQLASQDAATPAREPGKIRPAPREAQPQAAAAPVPPETPGVNLFARA